MAEERKGLEYRNNPDLTMWFIFDIIKIIFFAIVIFFARPEEWTIDKLTLVQNIIYAFVAFIIAFFAIAIFSGPPPPTYIDDTEDSPYRGDNR